MDMYFYHWSITDVSLYNCSFLSEEEKRIIKSFRRPARGASIFFCGLAMAIVYILCLQAMSQPKMISKACYKIMFCLGFYDLTSVIGTDFFLGYCLTFGLSFCDAPNLFYFLGCLQMMCWTGASFFCLLLAVNRMLEILKFKRETINFFYSSNRTIMGCAFGFLYSLMFFFLQTPIVYSNTEGTLLPDPLNLLGKVDFELRLGLLIMNNDGIVVLTFTLYGVFCFVFYKNVHRLSDMSSNHTRLQHQVFIQATLMCAFTFLFATLYSLFIFFPQLIVLPKLTVAAYQYTIGLQALIYLFCNQTIRNGVKENILRMTRIKVSSVSTIDMRTKNTMMKKQQASSTLTTQQSTTRFELVDSETDRH